MSGAHTHEHWVYNGNPTGAVKTESGDLIASVYGDDPNCEPDDKMRERSRLIAAAPELLAVLRKVLSDREPTEHGFFYLPDAVWIAVTSAIRKATGSGGAP